MKISLVVATLVIAFATPALADYYVALRVGSGGCEIMTWVPKEMPTNRAALFDCH